MPRIVSIKGPTVVFAFRFPERSNIGKYTLNLEIHFKTKAKIEKFWYKIDDVYVLFNPWCKEDPCFLDDESLKEYILNDSGCIYFGASTNIRERPWNFGQFEYSLLPGIIQMLERSNLSLVHCSNPIQVARIMAAMVNSNDENGVLIGAWPSNPGDYGYGYKDGTPPLAWKGSVKILEQYFKTNEPVKYAQCWVFSGVLTTVLRALGIPTRSITNFTSAHDSNGSVTIDRIYNKNNEKVGGDSVWNYHVWNEAWMAREDLRDGYGGWQAVDATPQEPSGGMWTCGPCPVVGLKEGNTNQPYDAPFIFAEVNADIVVWKEDEDGDWNVDRINARHVGKNISTKMPNGRGRLDITGEYKYPEGSDEVGTSVMRAVKNSTNFDYFSNIYKATGQKDITSELIDIEELEVGKDAVIKVILKNTGNEKREMSLGVTASPMYYTGVVKDKVKTQSFDVTLNPGKDETVTMTMSVEEYWPKVVDMCFFKVYCIGRVKDTQQTFIDEDQFMLKKPEIEIKAPTSVMMNADFQVELSLTNPLHIPLTKCEFTLEGASLFKATTLKHRPIRPGQDGRVIINISARNPGKRELIASFDSKELSDLSGSASIEVTQPAGTIRPRSGAR